jgi:hypothetical protein
MAANSPETAFWEAQREHVGAARGGASYEPPRFSSPDSPWRALRRAHDGPQNHRFIAIGRLWANAEDRNATSRAFRHLARSLGLQSAVATR